MVPRIVMHLDMDAFYAAIEQRDRAGLRGLPVIVGLRGRRGVVTTCSYEARRFGVHSAMPSLTAERLCPDGVWVAPRMKEYRDTSRRIFALVERLVPLVQRVSVDEAYGDLTGLAASPSAARPIAVEIRRAVFESESLTASIGIAANRMLAKIASDLGKPDGLTVIDPEQVLDVLDPLPVGVIPGVGPKLATRLSRIGVHTIAELRAIPDTTLIPAVGARSAQFLQRRSRGEDDSPVENASERRQISQERTYRDDLIDEEAIERELLRRADGLAGELRRRGALGRVITLKVRDGRFRTVTRARTLDPPTDLTGDIYAAALALWRERIDLRGYGVRLLGVGVKELCEPRNVPPTLFPDPRRLRREKIARAVDDVRSRFGRRAARPARLIDPPPRDDS